MLIFLGCSMGLRDRTYVFTPPIGGYSELISLLGWLFTCPWVCDHYILLLCHTLPTFHLNHSTCVKCSTSRPLIAHNMLSFVSAGDLVILQDWYTTDSVVGIIISFNITCHRPLYHAPCVFIRSCDHRTLTLRPCLPPYSLPTHTPFMWIAGITLTAAYKQCK